MTRTEAMAHIAVKNHEQRAPEPAGADAPADHARLRPPPSRRKPDDRGPDQAERLLALSDGAAAHCWSPEDMLRELSSAASASGRRTRQRRSATVRQGPRQVRRSNRRSRARSTRRRDSASMTSASPRCTTASPSPNSSSSRRSSCPTGRGREAVIAGETQRDGRLPINLSGGLKAKGHPVGATGCRCTS